MPGDEVAAECGDAVFLRGGGEMGARIRGFDWAATSLGPPQHWPQSLKTAVRIMLASRQPMWIGWGRDLVKLYNDPYIAIAGGKHPHALGQPAALVWSEVWEQIGPRIEAAMLRNQGSYDEALRLIVERNGYPEETYCTVSCSPIPDDLGGTGGILCVATDDTRRIVGERQLASLRELEARTAGARTLDDACRLSARCLEANPQDLPFSLIYLVDADSREAVLAGASGIDASHPAVPMRLPLDADGVWPCASVLRTRQPCLVADLPAKLPPLPAGAWPRPPLQAVAAPLLAPGQAGILIAGLNPFRLFDGDYRGFVESLAAQIGTAIAGAQACAEERSRAGALAEIDRAKTVFFTNVSHEMRTPLTLMLGPIDDILAKPDRQVSPEDRRLLGVARGNAQRLLKLVDTLLDFSRLQAQRTDAVYEPLDLAACTAELASMFRSAIERAGMRLTVDCPPLPQPVFADRDMWEQIVLNLLSNAFKYTLEGEIGVSLRAENGSAVLRVADTGVGIPPADLPKMFDRFHRVEGQRGRTHEGTGIGLAMVSELVQLHGGRVSVQSVQGQGSTFSIAMPLGSGHLPADRIGAPRAGTAAAAEPDAFVAEAMRWLPDRPPAAASAGTEAAPAGAGGAPGPQGCIVLADDNADMRDYLRRLLSRDYEVIAVSNGDAALAAAREHKPDLVLADVMMPGLDGYGLLQALRDNPATAPIPVLLLSARAGEEAEVEGIGAGASDYLTKPFGSREVLARVGAQVTMSRMRKAALARERMLRAEAEIISDVARYLNAELEMDSLLQKVTDAGVELTGASFGAFFHDAPDNSCSVDALSGAPREAFDDLELPRFAKLLESTFRGAGVLRCDDVPADPRSASGAGDGRPPVRSYLVVPVISRGGSVLGGLYFGHPDPGVFSERAERFALGIAAQAAVALDNAQLYRQALGEIRERAAVEAALRESEARLAESDRRKDEFLATLAHELRNPLAPLRNGLQIMRLAADSTEVVEQLRDMMERQVQHMVRLVDDLIDVSRIGRGKVELRREHVEISSVLRGAVETSRPLIDQHGHQLVIEMPDSPVYVDADVTRLAQVFANLLNNAAKYTPPGGVIRLGAAEQDGSVVIAVEDNGTGIPPEMLGKVFELFTQVRRPSPGTQAGLGIGLSIAKRLVEMHGGAIEARSHGNGRGSQFLVRLPALAAAPAAAKAPDGAAYAATCLRILVVDDNADSANTLAMILALEGNVTRTAQDGQEALRAAAEFRPHVAVLDIGMPKLNGYDACRRIREQSWGKDILMIALTGWGHEEHRRRSQEAGFDHHIVKPVDPATLHELLSSVRPDRAAA